MNKVSLRRNSVFLILMLLFSRIKTEQQITFTSNNPCQYYAQPLKSITVDLSNARTPGLVALAAAYSDSTLEYMPLELMMCAAQELQDVSLSSEDVKTVNTYYEQLLCLDESIVADEETVRKRCKTFNELCVRGNARIGGNLIVCGTICPDPNIRVSCGTVGAAGETGATGPSGVTGFTGFTGPQGAIGSLGGAGDTGATGPTSDTGLTGLTGPQGAAGAQGAAGTTGFTGPTGFTGFTGALGAVGLPGNTGNTGATGVTGFTGPQGARGAIGNAGAAGNTGPTGVTGITGFTGNSGAAGFGAGDAAFLYAYFSGATSVTGGTVALVGSASVPFTNTVAVNNLLTPASTDIQVVTTGIYEVLFTVSTSSGTVSSASLFSVALNGSLTTPNSLYSSGTATPSKNTGRVVIAATAGDIISVRCANGVGNSVVVNTTGLTGTDNQNISASIVVRQIA
ncbi:hypothetical protein Noda2021_07180 [Candidatus Dependentiae bacterium Noda2021]|nr:hypothetical protein Noda2021_07180 [Candidatus Dependentiae bacterium Noda2021]